MDQTGQTKTTKIFSVYSLILVLTWVLLQSFLFYRNGILTGFESGKYIEQANNLINKGTLSSPNFWLYSTEIFLIAASLKLTGGFVLVVIIQWIFNALASFYFYRLCKKLSDRRTAFVVTLLLILNFPFQQFNTFLFTESLFYSFIILLSCFLFQLEKLTLKNSIALFLFLFLVCFTRPTGLLLVPCVFIYLSWRFFHSWSALLKTIATIVISSLFIFILNLAIGSGGELNFILPFVEEHIICGLPTIQSNSEAAGNSLGDIFGYIANHPNRFFYLAMKRSLAFWGLQRDYFSFAHNCYLAFYFYPIFFLALISLKNWWKNSRGILLYILALVLMTWFMVMLSCDDWHNRFFLVLMPFFYLLIIPVMKKILDKLFPRSN
jgi:4-amino-4-deoxy-L-arabinose transferase-like glycosyltransferase